MRPGEEKAPIIYKQLNEEMRDGLKNIYYQISSATEETGGIKKEAGALITEASSQLEEVVRETESAAMNIMKIIEEQFEAAGESAELLEGLRARMPDNEALIKLLAINSALQRNLTEALTALSFQDITGQRIKKVSLALKAIERNVLDLYLSSGLALSAAEENPDGDAARIQAEAREAVEKYKESASCSELKGPDKNAPSQEAIDAMLSQLGL